MEAGKMGSDFDEARSEAMDEVASEYIQQGRDETIVEILDMLDDEIEQAKTRQKAVHSIGTSREYAFEGQKIEAYFRLKERIKKL
jgi:hypothetical protein